MPLGDINLSSNFSLSSQRPLDDRLVLTDLAERNAMDVVRRYNLMDVRLISTGESFRMVLGTIDNDLSNDLNWVETFDSMNPSDYYTSDDVDTLIAGLDAFRILSTSGDSYASFQPDGTNEYLTVKGTDASLIAEFLNASDETMFNVNQTNVSVPYRLVLDPNANYGINTGLWFSNATAGLYANSATAFRFRINNTDRYNITFDSLYGENTGTFYIAQAAGTATTPTFTFLTDTITGVGRAGTNQLSLIAGGVEGIRVEATNSTFSGDASIPHKLTVGTNLAYTDLEGLSFGTGACSMYQLAENMVRLQVYYGANYDFTLDYFTTGNSATMYIAPPTATNPSFTPTSADQNTGIGSAGTSMLSLIANSIEGIRVNSATAHSVAGIVDYETLVTDDDDIPNKKYVDESDSFEIVNYTGADYLIQPKDISPNNVIGLKIAEDTVNSVFNVISNTNADGSVSFHLKGDATVGDPNSNELRIRRPGSTDGNSEIRHRGHGLVRCDTKLYLGGGDTIIFEVNGTLDQVSPMDDVLQIEQDGTLSSLVTAYETLITADNDIPNKKFVDNINLPSGNSYKINSTQVVASQQSAIADATGTATGTDATMINELRTQLNTALAMLRTHGLIAT